MSGTESLPYGESKSPPVGETGHEHRLHRGAWPAGWARSWPTSSGSSGCPDRQFFPSIEA